MFLEDYIEPFSNIPALHFGFLLRKFLPPTEVLSEADRFISSATTLQYPNGYGDDGEEPPESSQEQFSYRAIGKR